VTTGEGRQPDGEEVEASVSGTGTDDVARAFVDAQATTRDAPGRPPTPAATVVPMRAGPEGIEVLLLRRGDTGAFGGMWVFPGGRVEPADAADPVSVPSDPDGANAGAIAVARRTAVREAAEEAGLDLDPDELVVHSFWLPPPEAPRRFATWFFLAPVAPQTAVQVDRSEVIEHQWLSPRRALAERDAGRLPLAPPTYVTIWQLVDVVSPEHAAGEAAARPPRRFLTRVRSGQGRVALVWEGDAAWPEGDLHTPGARRRLWVDEGGPWSAESPAGPR
jgi:8-oxo-dGTP pyrophosphatase MutT (NUDIX family)